MTKRLPLAKVLKKSPQPDAALVATVNVRANSSDGESVLYAELLLGCPSRTCCNGTRGHAWPSYTFRESISVFVPSVLSVYLLYP